jgi:soluble lytic murein transglycosylase-like protein
MRSLGIFLCLAVTASAGEYAVLANGARLHADRHEVEAGKVRLYNGDGFIELNAAQVNNFDVEETLPAIPGVPQVSSEGAPPAEPAAPAQAQASIAELADAAADKYGLPRKLVRSVIAQESGFQVKAVSPKGAIGPMQLMPGTARDLGVNPHDAAQNVDGGTRYLRDLLEKYNYGLWHALAAYNAGPGAVDKYRGVPPYRETVNYINRIDRAYNK